VVQAGGDIDLGTSTGITSNGNFDNPALSAQGSSVIVAAGTPGNSHTSPDPKGGAPIVTFTPVSEQDEDNLFSRLRDLGTAYATLRAQGDSAGAAEKLAEVRKLFVPLYTGALNDGTGSINMTNSHISTLAGKADLYLLARSQVNVGKSTFVTDKDKAAIAAGLKSSGIFTASGGAINIFGGGDLNVNESRVMTYLGGSITAWSDQGDLNAGRGSKTSINSQPPHFISLGGTPPVFQLAFTPPSAGSGIRALSYDPAVPQGDVFLFAPNGKIDAGEAGIAGGRIILGAPVIANAGNIVSGSGGTVGATGSEGGLSLGSLSGAGSVAENSKMIDQASSLAGSKDKVTQQVAAVDDFMSRWLDLKIVSFDDDESTGSNPGTGNDKAKSRKK
jgi:filamentous hemagglutinin